MDFDTYIENQRINNDLQEQKIFDLCYYCAKEIYYGNDYYVDDNEILCEDCFDKRQYDEKKEKYRIAGDDN